MTKKANGLHCITLNIKGFSKGAAENAQYQAAG